MMSRIPILFFIIAIFVLPAALANALDFVTDPFLQIPDSTGVSVVWFTDEPGTAHTLFWGDDFSYNSSADTEAVEFIDMTVYRHEARAEGLTPTRVPYKVVSDDLESAPFSLAPAPPAGQPIRALLVSDNQLKTRLPNAYTAVQTMIDEIDLVIFAGDLINNPASGSQWFIENLSFFRTMQGKLSNSNLPGAELMQNVPLYPVPGNHEVNGADPNVNGGWTREPNGFSTEHYEKIFTLPTNPSGSETYYAFRYGNCFFTGLFVTRGWKSRGTYDGGFEGSGACFTDGIGIFPFESILPESEQYEWLDSTLTSPDAINAAYRIVYQHHPIFSRGSNVLPLFDHNPADSDGNGRLEYRNDDLFDRLVPLFESRNVNLVQYGHDHVWEHYVYNDIHYLQASNIGNTYGFLWPEEPHSLVAENAFTSNSISWFSIFDSGTGTVSTYQVSTVQREDVIELADEFIIEPAAADINWLKYD